MLASLPKRGKRAWTRIGRDQRDRAHRGQRRNPPAPARAPPPHPGDADPEQGTQDRRDELQVGALDRPEVVVRILGREVQLADQPAQRRQQQREAWVRLAVIATPPEHARGAEPGDRGDQRDQRPRHDRQATERDPRAGDPALGRLVLAAARVAVAVIVVERGREQHREEARLGLDGGRVQRVEIDREVPGQVETERSPVEVRDQLVGRLVRLHRPLVAGGRALAVEDLVAGRKTDPRSTASTSAPAIRGRARAAQHRPPRGSRAHDLQEHRDGHRHHEHGRRDLGHQRQPEQQRRARSSA